MIDSVNTETQPTEWETQAEITIPPRQKKAFIFLMIFVIGGIFGFLYEELFYRIDLGRFVKRGITFGPWIAIYGFGAVLILLTVNRFKKHPAAVFLGSATVCGALEYVAGLAIYRLFHARLWNYNTEIWNWFNIGGFICLRSVLFFGASALLLLYVIHPAVQCFADRCGYKRLALVSLIPFGVFILDILAGLLRLAIT